MKRGRGRVRSDGEDTQEVMETQNTRRTARKHGPHPVDIHVGNRLKRLRLSKGQTQEELAEKLNVSFQQVQKYERGSNRINASRLNHLADILNVSVDYFFDGLPADLEELDILPNSVVAETGDDGNVGPELREESQKLTRLYYRIPDPALRKRFVDLTREISRSVERFWQEADALPAPNGLSEGQTDPTLAPSTDRRRPKRPVRTSVKRLNKTTR